MSKKITIDGPVAAGKTSTAKAVAKQLGFIYIDTGAVYRALAIWHEMHPTTGITYHKVTAQFENGEQCMYVDGKLQTDELRTPEISEKSSIISEYKMVRQVANDIIRKLADCNNVVIEGRDTGSVIFPDADLKIYLDACSTTRAVRRMLQRNSDNLEEIIKENKKRDYRDTTRDIDPLQMTDDMIELNNTNLTLQQTATHIVTLYEQTQRS